MSDLEFVMVPRDLYYHEVAYVRGLEARIKRLEAECREAFRAGYWRWCGPADAKEYEHAVKDEEEGWEEWLARAAPPGGVDGQGC